MVHSLSWSPSGRLLAAGLGDGNCAVFAVDNRSLVQVGLLTPGHHASVASVVFPSFAADNERVLISAGSDGAILCWDLGSSVLGEDHARPDPSTSLFSQHLLLDGGDLSEKLQDLQLLNLKKPKVLFGIPHAPKPNWLASRTTPATLYVADTTNDITAYNIPLR
jgi:WD40 repeat protein